MGKLALWGAVGGIGAGMQRNIDEERKQQAAQQAHERDMAIRKFEAEEAAKRQSTGIEAQKGMQTEELGAREKMQGTEISARQKLQEQEIEAKQSEGGEERKFRGKEGAANRASAEKIAGIRASAVGARGAAGKSRWQFSSQKTDATIDPATGQVIPGKAQQVLRDTNKGLMFVASGDRFLLPDTDPATTRRAKPAAVQRLLENPDQADNFLAMYKYLPAQFIARENARANYVGPTQAPTDDSASADQREDDFEPAQ